MTAVVPEDIQEAVMLPPLEGECPVSENPGPRKLSDDAELFAIALLKARLTAGSPAATRQCSEIVGRFEAKFDGRGLRTSAVRLAEFAAPLAGSRLDALEHLEQIEVPALAASSSQGSGPDSDSGAPPRIGADRSPCAASTGGSGQRLLTKGAARRTAFRF